jgi:hypothetical protein
MEYAMRLAIPTTAFGLALVAGAPLAHAQTVITQQPLVTVPAATVVSQPVETVQTTETVRTIRPAPSRAARRQEVTTRTITRQIVPTPRVIARTVPATPQPLYDEVAPAPLANPDNSPVLYDEAVPAAIATPVAQDSYSQPFSYRYVYEPDRILVVDPNTGIAVQALPR